MQTVLLFSFFNSNNIGDKAIAATFDRMLSDRFNVVKCSNEGNFDIAGRYVEESHGFGQRVRHKLDQLLGRRYMTPRYRAFLEKYGREIAGVDAVVIGGGNIMMDYTDSSRSYLKYRDYVSTARKAGKPCYALSVGIGPFRTDSQASDAVAVLDSCEYVSFRDAGSYDLFIRYGGDESRASIGYDPVFLTEKAVRSPENDTIALNVIDPKWDGTSDRDLLATSYASLASALAREYGEKKIVLFSTEKNDSGMMDRVMEKAGAQPGVSALAPSTLDELLDLYSRCSLMIGARMHSMIIAFSQDVPFIGLSWSGKTADLLARTDPAGARFDVSDFGGRIGEIVALAGEKMRSPTDNSGFIASAREAVLRDIARIAI